mmetsp:Transcript_35281/g.74520  ORF Transcript_35281/g.74520 Transcript_35281/m.74520 type:complete len:81 (+) Transcript_35281:1845-2087(+)
MVLDIDCKNCIDMNSAGSMNCYSSVLAFEDYSSAKKMVSFRNGNIDTSRGAQHMPMERIAAHRSTLAASIKLNTLQLSNR